VDKEITLMFVMCTVCVVHPFDGTRTQLPGEEVSTIEIEDFAFCLFQSVIAVVITTVLVRCCAVCLHTSHDALRLGCERSPLRAQTTPNGNKIGNHKSPRCPGPRVLTKSRPTN
jgi:hypothetical protein